MKYRKPIFILFLLSQSPAINAQGGVGINASGTPPDSSAMLDVSSTSKGTLITRMSTAQRNAIVKPATGLQIFNTDCNVINYNAGTPESPNWATVTASNVLVASLSISANPVGAVCAGTNVTFTATPAVGINVPHYRWQVNGATVGTDSSIYSSSTLNSGDVVTCVLTATAPCITGSPATSNAITMLVNIVPAITGTTPTGFCSGSAVTLSASANLGTINWYADSTGGSSLSSGASFTVSGLTSSTTYYVDASANGCTTASRTPVTATFYPGSPNQPGSITGLIQVNTDSNSIYSISPLPNTATYAWTVSLGTIVSGQGTTSIGVAWNNTTGTGSVSVVANNPCGASTAQTMNVYLGTETFSYTGTGQSFTVPPGINSINITAFGAQGVNGNGSNGGLGGSATGTLPVTPGSNLYVFAGGQTGYNGGGLGTNSTYNGGGESDVRQGGNGINNWVIVAGGGGGGSPNGGNGGNGGGGNACANGAGGSGGTSGDAGSGAAGTCNVGGAAGNPNGGWSGGGGGGGLAGGGAGTTNAYSNTAGTGTQGMGGNGGSNNNCYCCSGQGCGGGGGYYGGGGTSDGQCAAGCGGGGASWASASMTNTSFSGGVQAGNGQVMITW